MEAREVPLPRQRVAFTASQAVLHPQAWNRWGAGVHVQNGLSAFCCLLHPPTSRARARSPVFTASFLVTLLRSSYLGHLPYLLLHFV